MGHCKRSRERCPNHGPQDGHAALLQRLQAAHPRCGTYRRVSDAWANAIDQGRWAFRGAPVHQEPPPHSEKDHAGRLNLPSADPEGKGGERGGEKGKRCQVYFSLRLSDKGRHDNSFCVERTVIVRHRISNGIYTPRESPFDRRFLRSPRNPPIVPTRRAKYIYCLQSSYCRLPHLGRT